MKLASAVMAGLLAAGSLTAHAIDLANGQKLYNLHCAVCHGVSGIPVTPNTPNLAVRQGMNQPDMALIQTIKNGKTTMPPYIGRLNDQEIMDVIQYVRTRL